MVIKSLKLKNYRNYELLDMTFDSKTNILYGDNAQGKTNILEALYLSGTTKSHRGTKDRDLIQFGREESHLETIVEKKGMEFQIDMHLKKNSPKGIAINKIPIRKASELFGIVHFVFFSPEDLNIIKDGPAGRRRFIDLELSQIDKVYLSNLSNYNRIINQRNSLLKELYHQDHLMDTLDIWDMQLAEYGTKVIESRKQFIRQVNQIIADIHYRLTEDANITINECAGVLQYAQTVFEGMKAYTTEDGKIVVFRPDLNAARMADSARRLEMPVFPEERFLEAVKEVVKANAAYVPPYGSGATLYIRPYMFGSNSVIGVKPADEYQFRVFVTPVGPYFKGGVKP